MQVVINIEKKHLAFLVLFIAIIGLTGFTIAYDGSGDGEPTYMGHSIDEVFPGTYIYPSGTGHIPLVNIFRYDNVFPDSTILYIHDDAWYNDNPPKNPSKHTISVDGNSKFIGRVSVDADLVLSYSSIPFEDNLYLCEGDGCGNNIYNMAGRPLCVASNGVVAVCQGS